MDVVLSILATLILFNGGWAAIQAMSRAGRRRGYRGPFLVMALWGLLVVGLAAVIAFAVGFHRIRVAAWGMAGVVGMIGVGVLVGLLLGLGLVTALPRRPERVAGVRLARFPFRVLAAASGVVAIALPLLMVASGTDVGRAAPAGSGFLGLAGIALAMARRTRTPQLAGIDHLTGDEPFVLLLRGFGDERRAFSTGDAIRSRRGLPRLLARLTSESGAEVPTAERYLGPAIGAAVGPLVGLGNPADYVPPDHGVLRYYPPDDEWQRDVARLAVAARAVVVVASASTASLAWELQHLRVSGALTRTFLVAGDRRAGLAGGYERWRRHLPRLRWPELVAGLAALGYRLPQDPGPRCVLGFDAGGTATVLVSDAGSARDFAAAIARALPEPTAR